MSGRRRARGFTLLESAIALAITAVLLTAIATAVPVALRARDGATARLERATAARTVLLHLEHELAMAVREPVVLTAVSGARLEFTGGTEPGARIVYALEDGTLVRRATPRFAMDAAGTVAVPVLSQVGSLELAAFDGTGWVAAWQASTPPPAIRIRLHFVDGETAEATIAVPVARARPPRRA
jgi:prepilin-type N-terminal cleavage/methylation domain-containing protein